MLNDKLGVGSEVVAAMVAEEVEVVLQRASYLTWMSLSWILPALERRLFSQSALYFLDDTYSLILR